MANKVLEFFKSKQQIFACVLRILILLAMLFFVVFNTANSDYNAYWDEYTYVSNGYSFMEPGYYFLERIFVGWKASFLVFRGVYLSIAIILTFIGIWHFSGKTIWPLILYACFPFLLDAVQMRWFMAFSLILIGLVFLTNRKINIWIRLFIYLCFQALAFTQHYSSAICILFLLLLLDKKVLQIVAPVLAIVLTLVIVLLGTFIINVDYSKFLTGPFLRAMDKYKSYAAGGYNKSSYIIFFRHVLLSIAACLLASYFSKKGELPAEIIKETGFSAYRYETVLKILLIGLIFVPFNIVSINFYRLYRSLLVFIYMLIFIAPWQKSYMKILGILLCGSLFLEQMVYLGDHWYGVFLPIFQYNLFFK